jgi:hypothetical protein
MMITIFNFILKKRLLKISQLPKGVLQKIKEMPKHCKNRVLFKNLISMERNYFFSKGDQLDKSKTGRLCFSKINF